MFTNYTLNAAGQQQIRAFVAADGKPGLNADAWFAEAEASADDNDGHAVIELGRQFTPDGIPATLSLGADCFDATAVADE